MADNAKYKKLPIVTVEDAVFVMRALISNVMNNLHYYERYTQELGNLYISAYARLLGVNSSFFHSVSEESCIQLSELMSKPGMKQRYNSATDECAISGASVHDIRDKLLFRQSELFKYMGDGQTDSFSYKSIREKLKKKKFIQNDREDNVIQLLGHIYIERNRTAHFTQSELVGVREAQRHNYENMGDIQQVYNPVTCFLEAGFSIRFVGELYNFSVECLKDFHLILHSMQKDYLLLYEQLPDDIKIKATHQTDTSKVEYQYKPVYNDGMLKGDESIRLSKMIQHNQYDGSPESFKKAKR